MAGSEDERSPQAVETLDRADAKPNLGKAHPAGAGNPSDRYLRADSHRE